MATIESCLRLPRSCAQRISHWARDGYPSEACGLMMGRIGTAGVDVLDVERLTNVAHERRHERYAMDPLEQMRAEERAIGRGLALVGVWHSHPNHGARPSETDRAAAWEGYSYLIIASSPDSDGELRSWRLKGDSFVEERIAISADSMGTEE